MALFENRKAFLVTTDAASDDTEPRVEPVIYFTGRSWLWHTYAPLQRFSANQIERQLITPLVRKSPHVNPPAAGVPGALHHATSAPAIKAMTTSAS